jgi:hypothetical protein
MNIGCRIIFVAGLFLGAIHCDAQLTWDKTEIGVKLGIDDARGVAAFQFRNTGKYPVTISNITTSCPCTTAVADKTSYGPGDSGIVTATYSVATASGLQNELVDIETNDKANPLQRLTMKVLLPEVLKLSPPEVSWKVGEMPLPKTIQVDVVADHELNVTQALFIPRRHQYVRHFGVSLQTIVPHKRYLVKIAPTSTDSAVEDVVTIVTDYPAFQVKRAFGVASVKPADTPVKSATP